MLSYSTGASGAGADVDKVRAATDLVRDLRPDLQVRGADQVRRRGRPRRGQNKMPDSRVAGRATVFVVPDLNTGNNTLQGASSAAPARWPWARCCRACASRSTTCPAGPRWPTSSPRSPSQPPR